MRPAKELTGFTVGVQVLFTASVGGPVQVLSGWRYSWSALRTGIKTEVIKIIIPCPVSVLAGAWVLDGATPAAVYFNSLPIPLAASSQDST